MGKYDLCKRHSFVCGKCEWLKKRSLLQKTFKIIHTHENMEYVCVAVNKRHGPKSLEKTRLNMNTNFVKNVNRNIKHSLPSNVTYNKNYSGRAHSAIHSLNFGPGESIAELYSAFHCEIPIGSTAYQAL